MGNAQFNDNDEAWDYSSFGNCPVNPNIDPSIFLVNMDKSKIVQAPIPNSECPHIDYKTVYWLYLATPDNNWGIVGLFPRKLFKKLRKINPTYQIPNNHDYKFKDLCRRIIFDPNIFYKIMKTNPGCGISIIDLVPFVYKYTEEEQLVYKNDLHQSLTSICNNLDVLTSAREKCNEANENDYYLDKGINFLKQYREISESHISHSNKTSQKELLECIKFRELKSEDPLNIANSLNFMKLDVSEQWSLCKKRVTEMRLHVSEIIKNENWPCDFNNKNHPHQMYFNTYKTSFGSDRIGINIAPDTYSYVYMETALLIPNTHYFLDNYGYSKQNTREWKTFDDLVNELKRLITIYNNSPD